MEGMPEKCGCEEEKGKRAGRQSDDRSGAESDVIYVYGDSSFRSNGTSERAEKGSDGAGNCGKRDEPSGLVAGL